MNLLKEESRINDMSEILLVNPRKRRRKATTRKRRTSARRANPVRRKRRASPVRRRRAVSSRRRRRNPAMRLNVRSIQSTVMNAVPGALGALGLDILMGAVPFIPANFKTGLAGYATKGIGAIVLGMVAGNFVRPATAAKMTEGALTVMMHGALRSQVAAFAPQIPLGMYEGDGLGYTGSGWNPNYAYDDNGMGEYLTGPGGDDDGAMGAYLDETEELMTY